MKKFQKIMKEGKKYRAFFMILLMLMVGVTGISIVDAATPDTKPPVLKSISIKNPKTVYNAGDNVYFNINASDAVSGIESIGIGVCLYDENFKDNGSYPCKR